MGYLTIAIGVIVWFFNSHWGWIFVSLGFAQLFIIEPLQSWLENRAFLLMQKEQYERDHKAMVLSVLNCIAEGIDELNGKKKEDKKILDHAMTDCLRDHTRLNKEDEDADSND